MNAITKESKKWLAALTLVPDVGMKECDPWPNGLCSHYRTIPHTMPPDITPDLLYAILVAGEARTANFIPRVYQTWVDSNRSMSMYDAIIRVAASLQENSK